MAIFLLHQILSYNFALCLTFVLFAGILCCRLIFCNCWRFTEPSVLSFLTVNVYQGCPEAPWRRKMFHGNFRGMVKKLERAKFIFLFQGNISALNRLDSQINVLMFMSKMLYLDLHTAKTIVTSIVHSKLDYCNSLYYVGLPKYQINRLQHIQNFPLELLSRLQNSNTSLLFWNLFTGLKSFLLLTKFLIPLSHHISMTLYPFSLLMVTTHALHIVSLLSNHHHHSKSLIDPSDMLHLIFRTSFLHHSGFLIQIIHPPLSVHHLNMPTHYTLLSPSITFTLFHSKLKTYLFRKSYPHLSLFLSVGLISWL